VFARPSNTTAFRYKSDIQLSKTLGTNCRDVGHVFRIKANRIKKHSLLTTNITLSHTK